MSNVLKIIISLVFLIGGVFLFATGISFTRPSGIESSNSKYIDAFAKTDPCGSTLTSACIISSQFNGKVSGGNLKAGEAVYQITPGEGPDPLIGKLGDQIFLKTFSIRPVDGQTIIQPIAVPDFLIQTQNSESCVTGEYSFFNELTGVENDLNEAYYAHSSFVELVPCFDSSSSQTNFFFTNLGRRALN